MSPHQLSDENPGYGKITCGLEANTLTERTIEFVMNELPNWRDDLSREPEEAEERLNAQLCKFLDVIARRKLKMVFFHHEEKQTGTRRVDFSALPTERIIIGSTYHTIYSPFLVFEGKRLPAPNGKSKREREYVTGGAETSGGIQRFKLGLHGAKLKLAVIIGYVQQGKIREWVAQINSWIDELAATKSSDDLTWETDEKLIKFREYKTKRIGTAFSKHTRRGDVISPKIHVRHLFVDLSMPNRLVFALTKI